MIELRGVVDYRALRVQFSPKGRITVKTQYAIALAVFAGVGLGAVAVQSLHAQAKPMAYLIAEIDVTDRDGYMKEYLPVVRKALQDGGGKYIAAGGKTASFQGDPPKGRIVVIAFESLDKAQATADSQAFKDANKNVDKYAKVRSFAVEGVPQ
jgi:uncharacterized protein (DUF1330 family)